MKAGDARFIQHDLDFLNFVIRYEELHPDKELSYDEAVNLYFSYDIQWRNEVYEAKQFKRFVQDDGVQYLKGVSGENE